MLNFRVDGKGPPLLLIHGFGISFNIWQNLIPYLNQHFTLIMIELPGIGKSPMLANAGYLDSAVDGIEQVRVKLGIEGWRVFCYSSGTRVGERYVKLHADRTERIVFLCPAQVQWHKALSLRVAKWLDARMPRMGDFILSGARLNFLIRLLGFNLEPTPHARAWMDEISSQPVNILKDTIRSIPGDGAKPFEIPRVPHLFIWGTRDLITIIPRGNSPNHRLIRTPHAAPVMCARETAEAALPFLLD